MKKILTLLIPLVGFFMVTGVFAQKKETFSTYYGPPNLHILHALFRATTLPGSCDVGQVAVNADDLLLYYCYYNGGSPQWGILGGTGGGGGAWTQDGNVIYTTDFTQDQPFSLQVGIGTSQPAANFHINFGHEGDIQIDANKITIRDTDPEIFFDDINDVNDFEIVVDSDKFMINNVAAPSVTEFTLLNQGGLMLESNANDNGTGLSLSEESATGNSVWKMLAFDAQLGNPEGKYFSIFGGIDDPPTWDLDHRLVVSRDGKVGIGTTGPEFGISLEGDGGILAKGQYDATYTLPASAEGESSRLVWIPQRGIFRAGIITTNNPDYWDDINMGDASVAMGVDTKASGTASVAMGRRVQALANYAVAFGNQSEAERIASFAMGHECRAKGEYSIAMGLKAIADSAREVVLGAYNVESGGSPTAWNADEPIFIIGNGENAGNPSNAMTILKNGNVGIGTSEPTHRLHVEHIVRVEPNSTPPECNSSDELGLIYVDDSPATLCFCDGTSWQPATSGLGCN